MEFLILKVVSYFSDSSYFLWKYSHFDAVMISWFLPNLTFVVFPQDILTFWPRHNSLVLSKFHFCHTSLLIFTCLLSIIRNPNISKDQWQKCAPLVARYTAIHKSTQMTFSSFTFSFLSHVIDNIHFFDYCNANCLNFFKKYSHFGITGFSRFIMIFIFAVFPQEIHTFWGAHIFFDFAYIPFLSHVPAHIQILDACHWTS